MGWENFRPRNVVRINMEKVSSDSSDSSGEAEFFFFEHELDRRKAITVG